MGNHAKKEDSAKNDTLSNAVCEKPQTMAEFRAQLIAELKQMMYVSGETSEPSAETTGMIEEIVRQQVIEMVRYS